MSEIEVGEYVRDKDGNIGKITKIVTDDIFYVQFYDNLEWKTDLEEANIKAHSKNIIDLIEGGDYVNGYKVERVFVDPFTRKKRLQIEGEETNWQGDRSCINCEAEQIKTILTHEQYEANCYKVGEIE